MTPRITPASAHLQATSRRLHPKSLFVQARTGEMVAYPDGPYADQNHKQAEELRKQGFAECVLLAETATGHILNIVIEEGVNNGTDHTRKLAKVRPDGTPLYMHYDEYQALPATKREAMLTKKIASVSEAARLEQEVAALRSQLEAAKAGKGVRS